MLTNLFFSIQIWFHLLTVEELPFKQAINTAVQKTLENKLPYAISIIWKASSKLDSKIPEIGPDFFYLLLRLHKGKVLNDDETKRILEDVWTQMLEGFINGKFNHRFEIITSKGFSITFEI
jgi:hypothetical protein